MTGAIGKSATRAGVITLAFALSCATVTMRVREHWLAKQAGQDPTTIRTD